MDLLGIGALGLVTTEWVCLGWLSGVDWPTAPDLPSFWAARWALRLLIGAAMCAFAQLLLALVGVGFGSIPVVLLVAACGAGALRLVTRRPAAHAAKTPLVARMGRRETAGWLVLGAVLVAATLRGLVVPEAGWDAFSHWGLRAQAHALAGTVVDARSEHEYYPPLVPLLEAWLYLHRGLVSIDLGKTVWAVIGSAFGICLAWHLRLSLGLPWLAGWLATAIVVSAPAMLEGFWTGEADLALTAFLTLATLAILQWQRSSDRQWLVQAGVFSAAAALAKFEGLPRVGIVIVALAVEMAVCRSAKNVRPALVLGLASSLSSAAWLVFELAHGIAPNAEHVTQLQPLAAGGVLLSLLAVFGGVRTGGGLVVALLAWVVAAKQLPRLLVLVVLGQLAATLVAFLVSGTSPEIEARTSATRLFEQFVPLAMFAGAVGLAAQMSTYNRRGR